MDINRFKKKKIAIGALIIIVIILITLPWILKSSIEKKGEEPAENKPVPGEFVVGTEKPADNIIDKPVEDTEDNKENVESPMDKPGPVDPDDIIVPSLAEMGITEEDVERESKIDMFTQQYNITTGYKTDDIDWDKTKEYTFEAGDVNKIEHEAALDVMKDIAVTNDYRSFTVIDELTEPDKGGMGFVYTIKFNDGSYWQIFVSGDKAFAEKDNYNIIPDLIKEIKRGDYKEK